MSKTITFYQLGRASVADVNGDGRLNEGDKIVFHGKVSKAERVKIIRGLLAAPNLRKIEQSVGGSSKKVTLFSFGETTVADVNGDRRFNVADGDKVWVKGQEVSSGDPQVRESLLGRGIRVSLGEIPHLGQAELYAAAIEKAARAAGKGSDYETLTALTEAKRVGGGLYSPKMLGLLRLARARCHKTDSCSIKK